MSYAASRTERSMRHRAARLMTARLAMCAPNPPGGWPEGHFPCAYCATRITDRLGLPDPSTAKCWDCWLEDYDPPLLPWWAVAADQKGMG